MAQHSETKNIHERISLEALVEINFASDRRDADAIAVVRDARDDTAEQATICLHIWRVARDRSKAQRVQAKFRPCAHRENVADDSADAGGRALEWLDRARMIVALDLECDRPPVADIHDARVFLASLHENIRPARRKFFQFAPRIFVGTMFAPHHGEDSQLRKIRIAPENFFYALELIRLEAVLFHELGSDDWIGRNGHAWRTLANVTKGSTRERFSAHSRDRKFVEYGPRRVCLTFHRHRLFHRPSG